MLRSLLPPSKANAIDNIETQPFATGPNPTISTVLRFLILLPNDALFCPSLTCAVYDYILKGISQPLIGNFVINIGELQHLQDETFRDEENTTMDIIRALEEKIEQAEQVKLELEAKRAQAERERIQEEKLKQQLEEKRILKLRKMLAIKPGKLEWNKISDLKEEQKSLIKDNDYNENDIEMQPLKSDLENQRVEEEKVDPTSFKSENVVQTTENLLPKGKNALDIIRQKEEINEAKDEDVYDLTDRVMQEKYEKKEHMKAEREVMTRKVFKQMKYVGKNVIRPTYSYDQRLKIHREDLPPPKELFLAIGYDPTHESKQKHYRRFYEDELENIKEVMPRSPFQSFTILRGQSRGLSKGWFSNHGTDEADQASSIKEVGEFKGIISVINKDREEGFNVVKNTRIEILKSSLDTLSKTILGEPFEFNFDKLRTAEGREFFSAKLQQLDCENLRITEHFTQMNYSEELTRLMMLKTKCLIRVYVLDIDELPPKDVGGSCDPYIKVKLNDTIYNEKENYVPNCHNPDIYRMFEFQSMFPGCSKLRLQVWDHDTIFGDDFIGETIVDLEDRFFSPEWQSIKEKPVEYRQMYHHSTKVPQGVVKMWIEILPSETLSKTNKPWSIIPRPVSNYEVRLVIWDTRDVKMKDWEGTSDIYCRAFFDSNHSKRTDTHYRSMDGRGSFNYRLLFDVKNPGNQKVLNMQVWDADLFSGNDFIGDVSLNLALPIEDCTSTNRQVSLTRKYYDSFLKDYMGDGQLEFEDETSFWIKMKDKNGQSNGEIRVTIDILPKDQAIAYANAEGRSEPNHSPYCPPPTGRIQWSLNPWTMFNQCVAPHVRNKVC